MIQEPGIAISKVSSFLFLKEPPYLQGVQEARLTNLFSNKCCTRRF